MIIVCYVICYVITHYGSESGKVVEKRMSEFTDEPIVGPDEELYTNLTDHVFQLILSTSTSELKEVCIKLV